MNDFFKRMIHEWEKSLFWLVLCTTLAAILFFFFGLISDSEEMGSTVNTMPPTPNYLRAPLDDCLDASGASNIYNPFLFEKQVTPPASQKKVTKAHPARQVGKGQKKKNQQTRGKKQATQQKRPPIVVSITYRGFCQGANGSNTLFLTVFDSASKKTARLTVPVGHRLPNGLILQKATDKFLVVRQNKQEKTVPFGKTIQISIPQK